MTPNALSIGIAEFQSDTHSYCIPASTVKAYSDLQHFTYLIFRKATDQFDLHFHQDDVECDTRISEVLWGHGTYLFGIGGGVLKLYAHFTRREEAVASTALQTPNSATQAVHPLLRKTPSSRTPATVVDLTAAVDQQHPAEADELESASGQDPDEKGMGPPQHYTIPTDVGAHKSCKRERDEETVDTGSDPATKFAKHSKFRDPESFPQSERRIACIHKPIRVVREVVMLFRYIARTEGIFEEWKDLRVQLPGEAITAEVIDAITKDIKNAACNNHAPVRPYVRQVHFQASLGSDRDHLRPLIDRNLPIKEYGAEGSALDCLYGHVEVYLEATPGIPLTQLMHAENDELLTVQRPQLKFTSQPPTSIASIPSTPSQSDEEADSKEPAFCGSPVRLTFEVTHDLDLSSEQATRVSKPITTTVDGDVDGESVHDTIFDKVKARLRKLEGYDSDDVDEAVLVQLSLQPYSSDKTLLVYSPFANTTMVHQFLSHSAIEGEDRTLKGRVFIKRRDRICKCGRYEDEVLPSLLCDDEDCGTKCFHLGCVGLEAVPTSLMWYCPDCARKQDQLLQ